MLAAPGVAPLGGTLGNYYEEAISRTRKSAKTIVNNASKALKEKNSSIRVITAVVEGFPKSAILEKASDFGADLIVLGSQGHGAFSRFLLGSVSQSIVMHASCSVLIVRKKSEK